MELLTEGLCRFNHTAMRGSNPFQVRVFRPQSGFTYNASTGSCWVSFSLSPLIWVCEGQAGE